MGLFFSADAEKYDQVWQLVQIFLFDFPILRGMSAYLLILSSVFGKHFERLAGASFTDLNLASYVAYWSTDMQGHI